MFQFFIQYLKNPRSIGAVAPSGRFLAQKMMEPIEFSRAKCIVEYGPGTGVFTRELIKRKKRETILILIEYNLTFYQKLKTEFGGREDVHIINGSAENVREYIGQHGILTADYIVSGLPFASLPTKMSEKILKETQNAIGERGRFLTFQYTMLKRKFFEQYFHMADCLLEFWNLPPAYVMVMTSKKRM
ncbi:class I SAM-dependent methyltransferase [Hominifimenecus sp. rT4P-3]|uniref:class I SAM-dependent methyltransferase n=1 Tax=Hominifimenecus sp. rT4P-3 TaxID=3242979 RepID=UPI003DA5EF0B